MTTVTLSTFRTQVDNLISADDTELAQIRREQQIKAAMQQYSKDRPEQETDDVTGDGGKYYVLSTSLSNWIEDFSRVISIEYPAQAISEDETPIYLDASDWDDNYFADASGTLTRYLFLPNHAPAATETMRITYTVPYTWSAGSSTTTVAQTGHGLSLNDIIYKNTSDVWVSTDGGNDLLGTHKVTTLTDADNFTATELAVNIPAQDFFAICFLAACLVCKAIAAKYSRTSDSTINTDSVNHPTRAGEFRAQAKEFCRQYSEHLGLDEASEADKPASAYADWDTAPGWPLGRDFIFHGRDVR